MQQSAFVVCQGGVGRKVLGVRFLLKCAFMALGLSAVSAFGFSARAAEKSSDAKTARIADFSVRTEAGAVPIRQLYADKYVLLHFWATWCESCIQELKSLAQMKARLTQEKAPLRVATVALEDKTPEELRRFLRKAQAKALLSFTADLTSTIRSFRLRGVPTSVLIDKNGKEIWRAEGEREWNAAAQAELYKAAGLDAVRSVR